MIVAIDGPAGAGKSTVAQAVAGALGFTYLDTGAMYRCVALARKRDPRADLASIEIALSGSVRLDGEDVSDEIRSAEITALSSEVSSDPAVRELMAARQKAMMANGDWVAEGRDIGTVIAPQAEVKIFLTADPHERARRRAAQSGRDLDEVLGEQAMRDSRDSEREVSPLTAAEDALVLDTTELGSDEVVERIVGMARAAASTGQQG
ncbi:MAG: (d)CMP kinase [Actinobacteria bacterium]|uniref:(d)CMP kinase n=1 Tax=freshwater metagenome TaxID=449393 RepID=A0A6J5ZWV9_9ZZZZ|nr:(d)CMP kinase [Actinomycetota bacterium]